MLFNLLMLSSLSFGCQLITEFEVGCDKDVIGNGIDSIFVTKARYKRTWHHQKDFMKH